MTKPSRFQPTHDVGRCTFRCIPTRLAVSPFGRIFRASPVQNMDPELIAVGHSREHFMCCLADCFAGESTLVRAKTATLVSVGADHTHE